MSHSWGNIKRLSLIVSLIVYSLSFAYFKSSHPPVWPDEAIYADIAATFLATGHTGTSLWQGFVPKVETAALWYSPMFFHATALWHWLGGSSYLSQRLVAHIFAILVIMITIKLFRPAPPRRLIWAILPLIALVLDYQFQHLSRIYRPEIFVMALILLSLKISQTLSSKRLFIIGSLHGTGILLHPLATIFMLAMAIYIVAMSNTRKHLGWYCLGVALPVMVWGVTIFRHWPVFISQLTLMYQRKTSEFGWFVAMGQQSPLWALQFTAYLITSIWFIYLAWSKSTYHRYRLVATFLAAAWFIAFYGKMNWYYLYLYPLMYLCIHYLAITLSITHLNRLKVLLTLIIVISLYHHSHTINQLNQGNYSLEQHYQAILNAVPDNRTVLLSSIPDPYFAFKAAGRNNRLIAFPTMPISLDTYREILSQVDYVIYGNSYDHVIVGDFLLHYLKTHHLRTTLIGEPGEYQTTIVQLK
jgi:hypothetical protein